MKTYAGSYSFTCSSCLKTTGGQEEVQAVDFSDADVRLRDLARCSHCGEKLPKGHSCGVKVYEVKTT
jgi:hypothetical protein